MASSKKLDTPTPALNPFFITLNGITRLFSMATSVGIVILLIGAATTMISVLYRADDANDSNPLQSSVQAIDPQQLPLVVGVVAIIVLFSLVVSAMLHGIQSYTALRVARSEQTTIGEAFNTVLGQFGGYLWLYIWMNIKIFLWSLLLIVPGIIAFYRYSFAGVVFFDKGLRGDAAIKESNRLTKNGLMTIFASQLLFNLITLGYISSVVAVASTSELYREYTALEAAKREKPPVHWLSWFSLALPFILIVGVLLFVLMIAVVVGLTGAALTK